MLDLEQNLKNTKEKIVIGDDTPILSDAEAKDEVIFREKALALDKAAIKKGLTAKAVISGIDDLKVLIEKKPRTRSL